MKKEYFYNQDYQIMVEWFKYTCYFQNKNLKELLFYEENQKNKLSINELFNWLI
jgi:hypothetical protein